MIIFLVLSTILIIFTTIYLKRKNNKIKNTYTEKIKKHKNKKLADILEIKIKDNIIYKDNRFSNIIRLGNIDYNMLSEKEQNSVESVLMQTVLSIDYPIQFFTTTEFVDTSKVIEIIKQNKQNNTCIKEYQNHLINYLNNLMENRTITIVKNYAIISYDGNFQNALEELNRKTLLFKSNLLRANISCEVLDEDELYNLIYRELNKNSSLKIDTLKKGGENLYVSKKEKRRN